MKKYAFLPFLALILGLGVSTGFAVEFGDLLDRLNSDYTKTLTAEATTSWLGGTGNPNAGLPVFQARNELRTLINQSFGNAEDMTAINQFLAEAVGKDLRPTAKVWLLEQLAGTGTPREVPAIAPLLDSGDASVAAAAAAALAKIPGPEAAAALGRSNSVAAKAALADRNRPTPAWFPAESALPFGIPYASQADVDRWMTGYAALEDVVKCQTLAALAARGDRQYRPVVLAALKAESPELQRAGLLALEKLATREDVDFLLEKLATDRDLVIRLAGFIVADGFDDALRARLRSASDPQRFLDLTIILTARATDVRAEVFAKTTAAECPNRLALLQQISKLATSADVPQLLASALCFPAGGERDATENLIAAVCSGDAAPIIALLGKYGPADVYPAMCRTGGDAAKAELVKGLASGDEAVRDAAVRGLTVWPDATFADKMLEVATAKEYTDAQRVSALRAFIRVVSLPDDKIGIRLSRDEKLEKLQLAFGLATRVDEKRLILSRLAANRTVKSLQFAVQCVGEGELAEAAFAAIADHAHDNQLRQSNRDVFLPAMDLVIQKSANKDLVERVKRYKEQQ